MTRAAPRYRPLLIALLAALALLVVACDQTAAPGGGGTPPPNEEPVDEPGDPTDPSEPGEPYDPTTFDCGGSDHPCSFADVDPEVLARGGELLDEATLRRRRGDSYDAIEMWLAGHPEIAEVSRGDRAVRFRLSGGRALWLADRIGAVPSRAPIGGSASNFYGDAVATTADQRASTGNPVGADTNGDGKVNNRDGKRALVIDPFAWEWGNGASNVAAAIGAIDGYDVDLRTKTTFGDSEGTSLLDFQGWSGYDIIYLSTHGYVAEDGYAALSTGARVDSCAFLGGLPDFVQPYYACGKETDPSTGDEFNTLMLTADWFLSQYPAGTLDNKIVYFDACHLFQSPRAGTGLPSRLFRLFQSSQDSVFLGWTDVADAGFGFATAQDFFTQLGKGRTSEEAFYYLKNTGRTVDPYQGARLNLWKMNRIVDVRSPDPDSTRDRPTDAAALTSQTESTDLRAREVITLLDYAGNRVVDDTNLIFDLVGAPDDGRDDKLDLGVVVDGVEPGTQGQYSVRFEFNGERVGREVSLGDGSQVGEFSYRLNIEDLPLGSDVEETFEGSSFSFYLLEAIVTLPEGGESRYEARIVFEGTYWDMDVAGTSRAGSYGGNCASFVRNFVNPEGPDLGFFLQLNQFSDGGSNETTANFGLEASVPRNATGSFPEGAVQVFFTPASETYSAYTGAGTLTVTYNEDRMLQGRVSGLVQTVASMNPPRLETTSVEIVFSAFEVDTVQQVADRCLNANGAGG